MADRLTSRAALITIGAATFTFLMVLGSQLTFFRRAAQSIPDLGPGITWSVRLDALDAPTELCHT